MSFGFHTKHELEVMDLCRTIRDLVLQKNRLRNAIEDATKNTIMSPSSKRILLNVLEETKC